VAPTRERIETLSACSLSVKIRKRSTTSAKYPRIFLIAARGFSLLDNRLHLLDLLDPDVAASRSSGSNRACRADSVPNLTRRV
jgi:hypothetical protein